ncbi:MAG TPA: NAD(P)-dependent oxidoreductase [Actinomycetaceae bacterium]|nr:NAD(P)-dependent oxidoreductase [Actinomycetaceae bacterium]
MQIGFVGATGLMGHGMAKNIVTKGYQLAYTVRSESARVADLDEAGAKRATGFAELGRTSDVVVICVTSSRDVEQVVAGEDGLLTDPKPGLVIADATTAEPSSTLKLGALTAERGVGFVDAPLTRGPAQAEEGTLNSMVGGGDDDVAKILPIVETYTQFILRTGELGTAHTLKLINNAVIQAFCTAAAEGFAVAAASGLDPELVEEILSHGAMESDVLHTMGKALRGDYSGMEFAIDNARKDVRYYTRLAGDLGLVAPVGSAAHQSLAAASKLGLGQNFVPQLVTAQERLNGVRLGLS